MRRAALDQCGAVQRACRFRLRLTRCLFMLRVELLDRGLQLQRTARVKWEGENPKADDYLYGL